MAVKTKIKTETMKDLTKIYIDLSKCSEEQRKCIVQILNATGKYILWNIEDAVDFLIHYNNRWCTTDDKEDLIGKTELTYPEFIKLFEGGEGEKNTYTFHYLAGGKQLSVHVDAENLNKALIKFALEYHEIQFIYKVQQINSNN